MKSEARMSKCSELSDRRFRPSYLVIRHSGLIITGSWVGPIRFFACIGTMNPPLTPPRRGTDRTRTDACSPPGRGRGWVGSWRESRCRGVNEFETPTASYAAAVASLVVQHIQRPGAVRVQSAEG